MQIIKILVLILPCFINIQGAKIAHVEEWDFAFPSVDHILQRSSGRPFTISVEGNTGAGKTTLLEIFDDYPDISAHKEPVDIWTDLNGTDFLDLMYRDTKRWGMTFESLVQLTMSEVHLADKRMKDRPFPGVKIMERSIHSARACFIESLKPIMEPAELTVLDSWYKLLNKRPEIDLGVDLIIYIRTDPEVALERVISRARQEEGTLPLEYFQTLHRLHEDWLVHNNSTVQQQVPNTIIIDGNREIPELKRLYRRLARQLWSSIPEQLKTGHFFINK